ncbi:accessory gene regulator B family protein [Virgibacillus siamensis]|uniref:accessory gene regulator B family protein n=1 Tax=Virgibacillus siamensis TaxID=480071 RepID=UPI00362F3670
MLERISNRIAREICEVVPTLNREVIAYDLGIRLNWYSTLILTAMLGWIFNDLIGSLIAFAALVALRKFSGGVHFESLTVCTVVSALFLSTVPHIPLTVTAMMYFTAVSLIVFIMYAPFEFEERNPSHWDKWSKAISSILVTSNFFILSPIFTIVIFVQAMTILPWKGVKTNDEN